MSRHNASNSLVARNVSVRCRGKSLLEDVNLELCAGEMLGLLGPNGAGKSTLIKVMSAEVAPCAGHVCMNGRWLRHLPSRERARQLAVLPQHLELAFPFTAFEVALLGRIPHHYGAPGHADRGVVWKTLEMVDAVHLAARAYPTLSGGEQARVQLARVLAQVWSADGDLGGRYLLLDEPTAPLDIAHQMVLMRILAEVAARGLGVLLIVHDLNLASSWVDRMALLRDGSVAALGTPQEVVTVEQMREVFDVAPHIVAHPRNGRPWMAF